jgi:beta-glucuronidase
MGKLLFFCALLGWPVSMQAQGLITNVMNRQVTPLNGKWNYIVDPYETGYYNFHAEVYDQKNPSSPSAYYNNYHAKNKAELVEYDFDKSPVLQVPGDWNTQQEKLFYYEGTVWYKKSFDYPLPKGKRLFVHFGAVNYKAEVYINGHKLGTHDGGFTPFQYEVTAQVKEKGNYLVVKVDNKRRVEAVPAMNTDWWNYGGITRDVLLIEEPATLVQDYAFWLKQGSTHTIVGYVQCNQATQQENITLQIPELGINQILQTVSNGYGTFEITNPLLQHWSPEHPKLYALSLITAYQNIRDTIGFKTIETKGPDILLNGKSVFLRGISIHEEINGRRANSRADALRLLTWAKELGCNYVRLAHYPHNENMVRMADKLGLMVWEEIPVYWTIDFTNMSTYANAERQLTALINRDRNRASVIAWSMANETPLSEDRNLFLRQLIRHARELDPTRLISAALLTRWENGVGMIDDAIGAQLDIISFNQYMGWYGGDLKTAPQTKWATPYNKPVVVSEFGGDAKQGLHGNKAERWNEEYQAYLYQQNLLMIEKMPNIRGISPWILTDFRSPRRVLPGIQDGFNRKGLLSDKGVKKKAFYTLQAFYKKVQQQYL